MSTTPGAPAGGSLDDMLFGSSPAPAQPLQVQGPVWSRHALRMRGLHGWLRGAIFFYILTEALLIANSAMELWFWEMGADLDDAQIDMYTTVSAFTGLGTGAASLIVSALAGFMYLRFVYRGLNNLHLSKARGELMGPGWAVAYNFIPILSLWKPHQAMRQIWRSSNDPLRAATDPPGLTWGWWLLWLVSSTLANISFRMVLQAGGFGEEIVDYETYMFSYWLDIASSLAIIPSLLFLLPIIRQITDAQERWADAAEF